MKQRLLIVFALAAIGGVNQARADVVFMSVPVTAFSYTEGGNDGFTFTPNVNITVTALDYYLSPSNTLLDGHGVGIYAVSNQATPLVTATVGPCGGLNPACNLVTAGSSFDSVAVAPTELFAGVQYMLAGLAFSDELENGGTSGLGIPLADLVTAPAITLNAYYYDYNSSLDYPTTPYGTGYVGPNFQFAPDGGTTLALLGLAIAGLAGLRRKL
jgi:hypothetical protein